MTRPVATTPLEPGNRSAASERGRPSALLGILTLIAAFFLPIFCLILAAFAQSPQAYLVGAFFSTPLVLIAGTLATVYSARAGLGNRWSVAGFTTGLGSVILILVGDILGLFCLG